MKFIRTELKGAYIIDPEPFSDQRGFFARTWCVNEFAAVGINQKLVQCNISYNHVQGTLRGMHMQKAPFAEAKLVRCTQGSIYDVIIDLRKDSPTFLKHLSVELNDQNRRMLYVPEGFAHGFITLLDHSEIFYQMTEFYSPDHSVGYRYDDPAFQIDWPVNVNEIAERDRTYPDFNFKESV